MKRGPLNRQRLTDELAFFSVVDVLELEIHGTRPPSNRPPNSHLLSSFILR